MNDLDQIYSADWYEHDFAELQPEFDLAADGIVAVFGPSTAFDVGAGPGMLVRALRERGVDAAGIDGSRHAFDYAHAAVRPYLSTVDIRSTPKVGTHDVVICTEVAEHLDAEDAPTLVHVLTAGGSSWVVFTAAPPGQDGHHHVNCQPMGYWARLFAVAGYEASGALTTALRQHWSSLRRLSHMTRNVCVFLRKDAA